MKRQIIITVILIFSIVTRLYARTSDQQSASLWFQKDGKNVFLLGVNYPWYNGYRGMDLGRYEGTKTIASLAYFNGRDIQNPSVPIPPGVTGFNLEGIEVQFKDMHDIGIHVLRWFIGDDGRAFLKLDSNGYCIGIDAEALKHMDQVVELAQKYRIFLAPSLLDFRFISGDEHLVYADGTKGEAHADVIIDQKKRQQLIEHYIKPLVTHYADSDTILYWEIMNEAANVVEGNDPETGFTKKGHMHGQWVNPRQMQIFLNESYDAIKSVDQKHPVMPSGLARPWELPLVVGRVKADLYGAHYEDHGIKDYGKVRTVDQIKQNLLIKFHLVLDKPLIMTEGTPRMENHLDYYLTSAFNGGWAGYLPWSYYELVGLNSFIRYSRIVTSKNGNMRAKANIQFLQQFNRDHADDLEIPKTGKQSGWPRRKEAKKTL